MKLYFPFLLLAMLLLSACSSKKLQQQTIVLNPSIERLNLLTEWKIKGRVSVKTPKESFISHIFWHQQKDQLTLRLYGDLGQTYAKITSKSSGQNNPTATLEVQKKAYKGTSAEQLMLDVLGWQLPVRQMSQWIKGHPGNNFAQTNYTTYEDGTLAELRYGDWLIHYKSYKKNQYDKNNKKALIYRLPARLQLEHPELKIRLSVRQWLTEFTAS